MDVPWLGSVKACNFDYVTNSVDVKRLERTAEQVISSRWHIDLQVSPGKRHYEHK
jgi:hypothetical protein